MNILFIPHVPNLNVINRVYEFAINSNSYFLYWEMDNTSLGQKIKSQIKSLTFKQHEKIIQIPLLFKPENASVRFNTLTLNRVIDKLNIDVVVNANALLFDIKKIKVPVIYDLVDDHLEINPDIGLNEKRVKKIQEDIRHSQGVICVTKILENKVKKLALHSRTRTIENGLYIQKFQKAKSLKKELGLEGKKVFGYIGGIAKWTGIEQAIKQYLTIKDDKNAFLVVGGEQSSFYKRLVKEYGKDVLFIGQVSPDKVANYFKSMDIGLIPFELNDFTHNALPIKALEYGLSGAHVISTPLDGLRAKNFPFVTFCEIEKFGQCMQKEYEKADFNFEPFEWKHKAEELLKFIKAGL